MGIKAVQNGNLAFEIEQGGHKYFVDGAKEFGGEDKGPSPKGLLLGGLAGCSGMDVASILQKMRIEYDRFTINVDADQSKEHPKVYTEIRMDYIIEGRDDLDTEKIKRAVDLSMTTYCGVSAMLKKNCPIHYKIHLNGRVIHEE